MTWEIEKHGEGVTATDGVMVATAEGGKAFVRNAIKVPGGRRIAWLVLELDGVRAYINSEEGSVVLSKSDLYP